MKVYISGPVTGTGTEDYVERFQKAEDELYGQGFIPVNPAAVNAMLPEETAYEEYMKVSLVLLDMCDAIYLLEGWQDSRGANREYGYALAKDYIILRADSHPKERKYESVIESIEQVCEDICDNYCMYRDTVDDECLCDVTRNGGRCPLDRLN